MGGVVPAPQKKPHLFPPQPGRPLTLAGLGHLLGGAFLGLKQLLDALRLASHDRGDPEEKLCPAAPKEDSKRRLAAPNPTPSGHPVVSLEDVTEGPLEGWRVPLWSGWNAPSHVRSNPSKYTCLSPWLLKD